MNVAGLGFTSIPVSVYVVDADAVAGTASRPTIVTSAARRRKLGIFTPPYVVLRGRRYEAAACGSNLDPPARRRGAVRFAHQEVGEDARQGQLAAHPLEEEELSLRVDLQPDGRPVGVELHVDDAHPEPEVPDDGQDLVGRVLVELVRLDLRVERVAPVERF